MYIRRGSACGEEPQSSLPGKLMRGKQSTAEQGSNSCGAGNHCLVPFTMHCTKYRQAVLVIDMGPS